MPIYEYLCESCAVKFEKTLPASSSRQSQPCPSCNGAVERYLSDFSTTFINHTTSDTSGLNSLDNNFDRVVGKDSAEKWHLIANREKEKIKILNQNPEAAPRDLRRTDTGYDVMTKQESESFRNDLFKYRVKENK